MNITHKERILTIPDNSIQSVGDLEVVGNGYADQSKTWNQVYAQNFATLDSKVEALSATSQAHSESFTALDSKVEALSVSNQAHVENLSALDSKVEALSAKKPAPHVGYYTRGASFPFHFKPSAILFIDTDLSQCVSINGGGNTFTFDGSDVFLHCKFYQLVRPTTITVTYSRNTPLEIFPEGMGHFYHSSFYRGGYWIREFYPLFLEEGASPFFLPSVYFRVRSPHANARIQVSGTCLSEVPPVYFSVTPHDDPELPYKVHLYYAVGGRLLILP